MKIKKIIFLLMALFIISSCTNEISPVQLEAPSAEDDFNIEIFNVGKADAMVLHTKNHAVIIDTGNRGDGKKILNYLQENNIENIDYLFITHFDKDHVGGAVKLINNLNIENIVVPKCKGNNNEYERYVKAMEENVLKQTVITQKTSFVLDDVLFEVYPPKKTSYKETDNDFSLVISVTHGENKFLFAGDAEKERIEEIFTQIGKMEHTFLKVPHHGEEEDNSEKFIKAVNPQYAVITCSEEEPASEAVIDILKGIDCETFLTADGSVSVTSDGKNILINQ